MKFVYIYIYIYICQCVCVRVCVCVCVSLRHFVCKPLRCFSEDNEHILFEKNPETIFGLSAKIIHIHPQLNLPKLLCDPNQKC